MAASVAAVCGVQSVVVGFSDVDGEVCDSFLAADVEVVVATETVYHYCDRVEHLVGVPNPVHNRVGEVEDAMVHDDFAVGYAIV